MQRDSFIGANQLLMQWYVHTLTPITPILSTTAQDSAGDFGNAVYVSVKNRCKEQGDLSIAQVNKALDELNIVTEKYGQSLCA